MGFGCCKFVTDSLLLLLFYCLNFGVALDFITSSQFIKDPEAIVSAGNIFKLGFFNPVNSTNRYVGIWYSSIPIMTPVWVANRNKPLNDSSGVLTISEDGNLVVLNGQQEILWSSNVSNGVNSTSAQLTDDGNLVLRGKNNGNIIWESFQQPSNTLLPKMRLSANPRTGDKTLITSWMSPSDPSFGRFYVSMDPLTIPEVLVWNDKSPYWRSGPWNGQVFIGVPDMYSVYLDGFNVAKSADGTVTLSFTYADQSLLSNYVLSSEGKLTEKFWDEGNQDWLYGWNNPKTECDIYGKCGVFGSCNARNSPFCSCLRGFVPKNADEWKGGNWTNGCVRRALLQCERVQNGSESGGKDGFLKLDTMKVPDFAEWSSLSSAQACRDECLSNCSCIAYAFHTGVYCMLWTGSLIDIQKFSYGGSDLYIRLENSELDERKSMKKVIGITVPVGAVVFAICAFLSWMWMVKYGERNRKSKEITSKNGEPHLPSSDGNILGPNRNQVKLPELQIFNLQELENATNDFDVSNKLGQGGFGPVYRGKLPDGQEIAVKRLSRASGQGLEELMNEVALISKLQHRNLVRLQGCFVEGAENMLVYEYMPNKSLDAFLFDPQRQELLDWRKRCDIIEGICRGLLYLHRDSRLRIIHRDLKASNILLDQELNPKISDFGMARIFCGNEDQANTRKVVGTYGYMSPEYAMEGRFSEKSDVFSLGVLLLEIISGRRNTSFYDRELALSLLGYAWKLWDEGNISSLVNPVISDPCCQEQIFRCVHVGLLCVQEHAKDRPAVPTVISMLNSEIVDLPTPKKPTFGLHNDSFERSQNRYSINDVTTTTVEGR